MPAAIFCDYLLWPGLVELSLPAPVVGVLLTGSSVNTVIDVGVMRIITGRPSLSFALTTKELGMTFTSVNPADVSFCRSSCGRFSGACVFSAAPGRWFCWLLL